MQIIVNKETKQTQYDIKTTFENDTSLNSLIIYIKKKKII